MSCALPGGQRRIGLGRCGLEGVPIQGRRRGGLGTNWAGRHLQKNAISLGANGMGENKEGGLGPAVVKVENKHWEGQ